MTADERELERLALSAVLESLRSELEDAWRSSEGRPVRFRASDVTLTVETVVSKDKDASGRIRWWLVEAGAGVSRGERRTQTLVLKLTPGLYADDGGPPQPLDVGDEQRRPEG